MLHPGPRPVAPELSPAEREVVERFESAPDAFARTVHYLGDGLLPECGSTGEATDDGFAVYASPEPTDVTCADCLPTAVAKVVEGESMPRLTVAEANAEVRAAVDHAQSLAPEDRPVVCVWGDLTVTSGNAAHLGTHLAMIEHGYSDERPVQVLALYAGRLREVDVVREGCTPFDSNDYATATYALRLRDPEGEGAVVDRCAVRVDGRC